MFFFISLQPLMVRFQAAYKAHLLKQQEKVNLELRELVIFFGHVHNIFLLNVWFEITGK